MAAKPNVYLMKGSVVAKATLETNTEKEAENTAEVEEATIVDTKDEAAEIASEDNAPKQPRRRAGLSVMSGILLGGAIAAGIGFYAARYIVPEGWPFPGVTPEPNPIAIEQNAQGERLAALEAQLIAHGDALADLEQDKTPLAIVDAAIADLAVAEAKLVEIDALVVALNTRLTDVEKIPDGSGNEAAEIAAAAYERELAAIREMFAGELTRIEASALDARASEQSAEENARLAAVQAALANVRGALDSGLPFMNVLSEINVEIPAGLLNVAESGVVTLPSLQEAFPKAARSALDVSIQAGIDDGSVGRFAGFFQRQLGTRSLEPKEGDGPDAVLSRAEAALKTGDLARTLQEITALPEIGRAEMTDWSALAQQRLDAMTAIETLVAQVNGE